MISGHQAGLTKLQDIGEMVNRHYFKMRKSSTGGLENEREIHHLNRYRTIKEQNL
jgi:hypothetical protein